MSYGVRFEGPALIHLNGLPADEEIIRICDLTWIG